MFIIFLSTGLSHVYIYDLFDNSVVIKYITNIDDSLYTVLLSMYEHVLDLFTRYPWTMKRWAAGCTHGSRRRNICWMRSTGPVTSPASSIVSRRRRHSSSRRTVWSSLFSICSSSRRHMCTSRCSMLCTSITRIWCTSVRPLPTLPS